MARAERFVAQSALGGKLAWFGLVFPALLLNYLGQGAYLLSAGADAGHPFYSLVPEPLLYPMVGLATAATVVASQALISGAFSLTHQASQLGYFPPAAKKRVLVVLTDGESRPLTEDLADAFSAKPAIEVMFVHLWEGDEQVFIAGVPEVTYRSDPTSASTLEQVAQAVGGEVLDEGAAGSVPGRVRELIGDGPTANREHEGNRRALMPWITLLTVIPLAYVLRRRNG